MSPIGEIFARRVRNRWSQVVSGWKPNLEYSMDVLTKLNSEMHEILPECEQSSAEEQLTSNQLKEEKMLLALTLLHVQYYRTATAVTDFSRINP